MIRPRSPKEHDIVARKRSDLICGLTLQQVQLIIPRYAAQPWEADYCPYTPEIIVMHAGCQADGLRMDLRTFSHKLIALRKHSDKPLPGKDRRTGHFPFDKGQSGLLIWLYYIQPTPRDRLCYTDDFNRLANEYRLQTCSESTDMQIFHGLMTLGKRGRLPRKGHTKGKNTAHGPSQLILPGVSP
jgi:hypothetical protein